MTHFVCKRNEIKYLLNTTKWVHLLQPDAVLRIQTSSSVTRRPCQAKHVDASSTRFIKDFYTDLVGFPSLGLALLPITTVWCEINSLCISEWLLVNNLTKTNNITLSLAKDSKWVSYADWWACCIIWSWRPMIFISNQQTLVNSKSFTIWTTSIESGRSHNCDRITASGKKYIMCQHLTEEAKWYIGFCNSVTQHTQSHTNFNVEAQTDLRGFHKQAQSVGSYRVPKSFARTVETPTVCYETIGIKLI